MAESGDHRSSDESAGEEQVTPTPLIEHTEKEVSSTVSSTVSNHISPTEDDKQVDTKSSAPTKGGSKKAKPTKRVQLKMPAAEDNPNEETSKGEENSIEESGKPEKEVENEADEEEEDEEEEDGPQPPTVDFSKILGSLLTVISFFGSVFRRVARFFLAALCWAYGFIKVGIPCTIAMAIFALISYIMANYVVEVGAPQVVDFESRMEYVVRAMSIAVSPTIFGLVAKQLSPVSVHKRFTTKSLEDCVLLFVNSLVLASYEDPECFHCIYVLITLTTIYRLCSWAAQMYGSPKVQYMFSTPVQMLHVIMGAYNLYNVLGADLGLFDDNSTVEMASMETQTMADDDSLEETAEWQYPDLCGVVEQMFCNSPQHQLYKTKLRI